MKGNTKRCRWNPPLVQPIFHFFFTSNVITPEIRGFSLTIRVSRKFRGFYADIAPIGFLTNLMLHGFWDTRFFLGTKSRITRGFAVYEEQIVTAALLSDKFIQEYFLPRQFNTFPWMPFTNWTWNISQWRVLQISILFPRFYPDFIWIKSG